MSKVDWPSKHPFFGKKGLPKKHFFGKKYGQKIATYTYKHQTTPTNQKSLEDYLLSRISFFKSIFLSILFS
jgi:hypothetical protein